MSFFATKIAHLIFSKIPLIRFGQKKSCASTAHKPGLGMSFSVLRVINSMHQRHNQAPAAGASREEGVIAVHFPGITVEQITDLKAQLQLRFAPVQLMTQTQLYQDFLIEPAATGF